jgi:hypothetical protein
VETGEDFWWHKKTGEQWHIYPLYLPALNKRSVCSLIISFHSLNLIIFSFFFKNQFRADLFCTYHMLARQFILFVALLPSLVSGDAAWIEENEAFLKENKNAPFVHELPSGLQYKILVPGGEGPHPKATSPCTCHYSGKLING